MTVSLRNLVIAAGLSAALAACGGSGSEPAKDTPPAAPAAPAGPQVLVTPGMPVLAADKDAVVKRVYSLFAARDFAALEPMYGPEFKTEEAKAALPQIIAGIPPEAPTSVRLSNWKQDWSAFEGPRTEKLGTFHEYLYPDYKVVVETVLSREYPASGAPGPWVINGFHIDRKPIDHGTPPAKS